MNTSTSQLFQRNSNVAIRLPLWKILYEMQSKSTNQAGTLWCKIVFSLPLGGWEKDYDYYAESPMLRELNKEFLKM